MPWLGGTVDMREITCVEDLINIETGLIVRKSEEEMKEDAISLINFFRHHYLQRTNPQRFKELRRRHYLRKTEAIDSDITASGPSQEVEAGKVAERALRNGDTTESGVDSASL